MGYDAVSVKNQIPTFPSEYSVTQRLIQKERNPQIRHCEELKTRRYKYNLNRKFVQGYSKELNKLSSYNWKTESKHSHWTRSRTGPNPRNLFPWICLSIYVLISIFNYLGLRVTLSKIMYRYLLLPSSHTTAHFNFIYFRPDGVDCDRVEEHFSIE